VQLRARAGRVFDRILSGEQDAARDGSRLPVCCGAGGTACGGAGVPPARAPGRQEGLPHNLNQPMGRAPPWPICRASHTSPGASSMRPSAARIDGQPWCGKRWTEKSRPGPHYALPAWHLSPVAPAGELCRSGATRGCRRNSVALREEVPTPAVLPAHQAANRPAPGLSPPASPFTPETARAGTRVFLTPIIPRNSSGLLHGIRRDTSPTRHRGVSVSPRLRVGLVSHAQHQLPEHPSGARGAGLTGEQIPGQIRVLRLSEKSSE
jgi:hypothetical protein